MKKTLNEIIALANEALANERPLVKVFNNREFDNIDIGTIAHAIQKDEITDPKLKDELVELLYKVCLSHIAYNEKNENYDKILSSATPGLFSYLFKKVETYCYVKKVLKGEDDFLKKYFFKAMVRSSFYYMRQATVMFDSKKNQKDFLEVFKDIEKTLNKKLKI